MSSARPSSAWKRFWERAPRQLHFTRAGKILVGLAFATGFAAINTGNNLLFLGWGLVLSSIVLSGVLSEGALRKLYARARVPAGARVGESALMPVTLGNDSAMVPSFALELSARIDGPTSELWAVAPYQLRLLAQERRELVARFVPSERGRHIVSHVRATTTYPFGFFAKSRRFPNSELLELWVAPRALEVERLVGELRSELGDCPARRAGVGDEFFSLRPFRSGDDLRRVYWRRSARSGRLVVRESEAASRGALVVELKLGANPDADLAEHAIALAGSVAEQLLEGDRAVGLLGPGSWVPPAPGAMQASVILSSLARLDPKGQVPRASGRGRAAWVVVALVGAGTRPFAAVTLWVDVDEQGAPRVRIDKAAPAQTLAGARTGAPR